MVSVYVWMMAQLDDIQLMSFELATGLVESSLFESCSLEKFRRRWASFLLMPAVAETCPEGQRFYLHLISRSLEILGDPDVDSPGGLQGADCSFTLFAPKDETEQIG